MPSSECAVNGLIINLTLECASLRSDRLKKIYHIASYEFLESLQPWWKSVLELREKSLLLTILKQAKSDSLPK
ncbi:MAG: hypothetical protein KME05_08815 [Gloeocapsa sp. UFS-A4-WI-NPMV-4B04]|nr:hypothetical protein [Gloeocapsa sp. UFS-A4-WI-NPMV-4B04]